ncbi:MAG: putative lipid II flippase FtsW [Acidiferrobacterales bacterium]
MSAIAIHNESARGLARANSMPDPWLLGATLVLLLVGLMMVYSASISIAEKSTGNSMYFLMRQMAHVALGGGVLWIVAQSPVRMWENLGPILLLFAIALLIAVLIPGIGAKINGSTRWIRLGGFNLQPSEMAKLFMVIYVAGYLVRKQEELRNFTQGILMIGIVLAVMGILLLQEPDLGTVVVMTATALTMMFLAGIRFWHFLACIAAGVGAIAILTVISPYRMERVSGFLNPWADPFDSGFQLVQSLIAFGRGEWFGVGLGASVQKLFYLPAAHTDFIVAVIAEEFGLLGVIGILILFVILVGRAMKLSRIAEQQGKLFHARLAQGLGLLIGFQAMINIGVNLGVLPTKGLTLPFVSYGGSSMIASCFAVGLLLAISREVQPTRWNHRG